MPARGKELGVGGLGVAVELDQLDNATDKA